MVWIIPTKAAQAGLQNSPGNKLLSYRFDGRLKINSTSGAAFGRYSPFCVTGITVYDSDGLTLFTLKESFVPSESRCESSLSLSGCFGFLPGDISSYFQEPFRKSNL